MEIKILIINEIGFIIEANIFSNILSVFPPSRLLKTKHKKHLPGKKIFNVFKLKTLP